MTVVGRNVRRAACRIGFLAAFAACLPAQAPSTEWVHRTDPADVLAGAAASTSDLQLASARVYVTSVGAAFFSGRPPLAEADRLRCVQLHLPLLRHVANTDGRLAEWFGLGAAVYLAHGNQPQGALEVLDEVARLLPGARDEQFRRCQLRVDCLVELQQLGAAERAARECENQLSDDLQRARLLAQRGSVNVMLGRLDLATEDLQRAGQQLESVALDPTTTAAAGEAEFDLLLRRLDLFSAREQFERTRRTVAEFERHRVEVGQELLPWQQQLLRMHAAAASYHLAQHEPEGIVAAAEQLAKLRSERGLPPRNQALATVWAADLALQQGRLDEARDLLAVVDGSRQPRLRWQRAPIAARLARLRGDSVGALTVHREALRSTLDEMVSCWGEVAWGQETTGFLRLGSRTRVLSELIAITLHLLGPEQALQHVLDIQCCTTVSRARGVTPAPQERVRERALAEGFGALVFVPAWNESHLFVVDRSQVSHVLLPRARVLREAAERLRIELDAARSSPDAAALDRAFAAAAKLGELLLPPPTLARLLPWRGLTITGNSLLGEAPLECLQLPDGRLLGERVAVATIGSLPLLAHLRHDQRATAAGDSESAVCLLASTMPGADFALRNGIVAAVPMQRELRPVLDRLPEGADVHLDGAATVSAWQRACARQVGLMVLMAHGESPHAGRQPALGLTPDTDHPYGVLTPTQVLATRQRGLVVIAACDSASGSLRMGDDEVSNSLAGAFLQAGAQSVIASTAPQRLRMSVAGLAALIGALQDGHPAAEALRRARVEAVDDRALRLQLAQMTMVGDGDARMGIERPVSGGTRDWLLAGAFSFLLLALLVRLLRSRGVRSIASTDRQHAVQASRSGEEEGC